MKNMKKFITLCGFLILGSIACGDADVVKAEAVNEQTTDTSGYTITIPSDVDIDKESGKGSFVVSGKTDAQVDLNVSVSSKNNYKLKNKSQEISYSLDKESFHIDNKQSASSKSFNENFTATASDVNTNFSGNYKDNLVFDITGNKYMYKLDANSLLDGKVEFASHDYGSFDVYINGQKIADDVSNFDKVYPYGTEYEFKDLKGTVGHHYSGVGTYGPHWKETPLKGKLGIDAMYYKADDSPYLLTTPCYFKFDTNKLTINYHADGATKLLDWSTKPESYKNISDVDIFNSTTDIYGAAYSNGVAGLTDAYRLSGKQGYKVLGGYWKINKTGEQRYSDNIGFKNTENCAEYLGVLNELKKNDVTVDLYPIWEPLLNTITYDANGGTLSTAKTQQFYTGTPYKTPENSKSFSGTSADDCEDLGYYNYSFGNKLTISTKIRFNSSDDTLPQKSQEFFCNYEWGGFGLGLGEDARPFFSVFRENKDDYDILRSKTKIKPNETYWVTGVYYGPNNTMSIYINGEKTNTIQLSATDNSNIKVSPLGLSLGGNPTGGCQYSKLTKGDIWQCGLWQNALSDEEVMKMYKTDTLAEGSFISRDYSAPKKTYYLFDGWYTQPTGGNKITTGTIINSSMTLYAHYKPILSFINYDSNEGTGVMQSETILSSDKAILSKNIFTKDGYTFKGWIASREYKSNVEYLYVNPNGGGGWFEKGKQPSGWNELYLFSDQEAIYLTSAYDGLILIFHAQWEKAYSAGDTLDIEGTKYVVLEQKENNQAVLITADSIENKCFQAGIRSDGQNENTYEGSTIDNYLENEWYNGLSSTMKAAIQTTSIKQASYSTGNDPNSKQDTGYKGQVYNTISRHAFLPSVSELGKVVDFNNPDKVKAFTGGWDMWTRDSYQGSYSDVECLVPDNGGLLNGDAFSPYSVRPAFVIDLSKVNYTVTGTVNYK